MPLTDCSPVVFLFTRDRATALPFYRDILGLTHTESGEYAECFDLNGTPLRLVPIADHAPHPHTVLGWNVPDIAAAVAEMQAKGIAFQIYDGFGQDANGIWTDPSRGVKIAWFLDPDGNNLSITQS